MSAVTDLVQQAAVCVVRVLDLLASRYRAASVRRAPVEEQSACPANTEQDLRDRERELRILMSNWM